jgi:two-component system response regulator FlrC
MDPRLQAKLLRAIQEREIDRVGGSKPISIDVRIVATSNRDIADEVSKGTFREDLYFRLNVVNLTLPPLRERPLDIERLSKHFINKYAEANGVDPLPLASTTRDMLNAHKWPGNVRELENTMHRAVLLASGTEIGPDAIMLSGQPAPVEQAAGTDEDSPTNLVGQTVASVERDLIIDTLQHCLGNRTHAANILGISIRTLRNKLKLYNEQGFQVPTPGETDRPSV